MHAFLVITIKAILIVATFLVAEIDSSSYNEIPVNVKVLSNLRRSAEGENEKVLQISSGSEQDLKIGIKRPFEKIFSTDFKFYVLGQNGTDDVQLKDNSPSKQELSDLEDLFYIDPDSGTAVSVTGKGTDAKVKGVVKDQAITYNETGHSLVPVDGVNDAEVTDFIDLKRNLTPSSGSWHKWNRASTRVVAKPEVWIVFDYANSRRFKFQRKAILDYLGVFYHAVNSRYASITGGLSITFRITAVTIITSRQSQSFLEQSKISGNHGYDMLKSLQLFTYWAFKNKGSLKFDLAAVLTGEEMMHMQGGRWSSSIRGMAYLESACYRTSSQIISSSVSEDIGGFYKGVHTVSHELAHNLGANHDGFGKSRGCSWNDGYIMSYIFKDGRNKLRFSSCSINSMKSYIQSSEGSCTRSTQSRTSYAISKTHVGDRLSMKRQCELHMNNKNAIPEPNRTPNELCAHLHCRIPVAGRPGYFLTYPLLKPAEENTPCGNKGGKCKSGQCK